jgi:hypothetical protein
MLPSALIVSVQSAKIVLLETLLCAVALYSEPSPIHSRECASWRPTEPVSAFLCAAQDMAVVETGFFIATLPKANFQCHGTSLKTLWSIGAGRSAGKRNGSNGQPLIPRGTLTLFLDIISRVNARYAPRCWHQNWIKGSCANSLFLAPLAIPASAVPFLLQTVHYPD